MRDIAIYGFGGFGREIACLLRLINQKEPCWNLIGFFDDGKPIGERNDYGCVLGGLGELNTWNSPLDVVLAIGSVKVISKLTQSITNPLLNFPNVIAPDVVFLDENTLKMGRGNVISMDCLISCNVSIGNFNLFNSRAIIGHDAIIGDCNVFMPSNNISGQVTIGNENLFGVASVILQKITIGNRTVVGANSLIIHKTKDGMTYMGNPATIIYY